MSTAYKITDPDVVSAYNDAAAAFEAWRKAAVAFVDSLPGVRGGFRRGGFTGETSHLILQLDSGANPADLPEGWRYVKTRGTVEPKLHKAGGAARTAYAPFADTPPQPIQALTANGVPSFVMDTYRSGVWTVVHFEHEGAIYLRYGEMPKDERVPECMEPIKTSEWHAAREALEEQERS